MNMQMTIVEWNTPSPHFCRVGSLPLAIMHCIASSNNYVMLFVFFQRAAREAKDTSTCRRYPPGSWHAAVSARTILAYFRVAPSNHEDLEASVTEGCSACRRMEESSRAG